MRDVAIVTHGQVIEALVANRLPSPKPLVHVEDWARTLAVEEVFDVAPKALTDDRIGRALGAVAPSSWPASRIHRSSGRGRPLKFYDG